MNLYPRDKLIGVLSIALIVLIATFPGAEVVDKFAIATIASLILIPSFLFYFGKI